MVVTRYRNVEQIHNSMIDDNSFKNVGKFKYLGITVTNQNFILE